MEDSLRNITNKDTSGTSRIPDIVSGTNCTDHRGQFIPNGLLYTPRGSDPCSVCTCASGDPILCRTVLCAPPTHCDSIKIPDKCCKWICLDELHPVGGINTEGDRNGGGPVINVRYTPGNGADIGLRLVASSVTAILSLCLLFFLVYRLRRRSQRRSLRNRNSQHALQNSMQPDQHSIDSITITAIDQYEGNPESHATTRYLGGLFPFWWKPRDVMEPRREPPPSYDQTMNEAVRGGVRSLEDDDSYSTDSYGSEAPSYSDIYHDPVIHQTTPPCPPPSRMQAGISLPLGAALVLPSPAPPLSQLNHVPSPRWDGNDEQCNTERSELHEMNNSFDVHILTPIDNASNVSSRTLPRTGRYLAPGNRALHSERSSDSPNLRNNILESSSTQYRNRSTNRLSSPSESSRDSSSSTLSPGENSQSRNGNSTQRSSTSLSNNCMYEDTNMPCTSV